MANITTEQCKRNSETCYKTNILPIMEELKNISKSLNDFKIQIIREIAGMPDQLEGCIADSYI